MKWIHFFLAFGFVGCLSLQGVSGQQQNQKEKPFCVAFYNLENYFDAVDDSTSSGDNEFTPQGTRRWTYKRYRTKRNNLYKVILGAGVDGPPDVIGFSEAENIDVLEDLAFRTPLRKFDLGIIHKDSPDPRGIDIGIFYRKSSFVPYDYDYIPIKNYPRLREILHVAGIIRGADTLHVFVNHWPSKIGGKKAERKRVAVAQTLRLEISRILKQNSRAKIIAMGDFNDDPWSSSLKVLSATDSRVDTTGRLINLAVGWEKEKTGTIKYHGRWQIFDQIFVSPTLLNGRGWTNAQAHIVRFPFLLEKDSKYLGVQPYRTFNGWKYQPGFSDHLPVAVLLKNSSLLQSQP